MQSVERLAPSDPGSPHARERSPREPLYRKVMWKSVDDDNLRGAVERFGMRNWSLVAPAVPGRNGKQCRERWFSMLDPELATAAWGLAEDQRLVKLHDEFGNGWARIAQSLPGRSRISLRNRWGWLMRRHFVCEAAVAVEPPRPAVAAAPLAPPAPLAPLPARRDDAKADSIMEGDLWLSDVNPFRETIDLSDL